MSNGKVTGGEKPRRVVRVIAHLQRQPRPVGAYKRKVLEEHSVTANVQTRNTGAIRFENDDRCDSSKIY
jgi:hypothetical protein